MMKRINANEICGEFLRLAVDLGTARQAADLHRKSDNASILLNYSTLEVNVSNHLPSSHDTSNQGTLRDVFHPGTKRGSEAWFPLNDAASVLLSIVHIWSDMDMLKKIRATCSLSEERQLLLKYVVIEMVSLMQQISKLQEIVNKAPERTSYSNPHSIYSGEREEANRLFKIYNVARSKVEHDLTEIRNQIAAHRGNLDWSEVIQIWDKHLVGEQLLNPILSTIPPIIEYVQQLDLFAFSRSTKPETYEVISFRFRPGDFGSNEAKPDPR